MKEKLVAFWRNLCHKAAVAARKTKRALTPAWEALYQYHYQLGVYVLRRGRRLIRFLARITEKPRRRLRYLWLVTAVRPCHRFFHRMGRLVHGFPRAYQGMREDVKKNWASVFGWIPRGFVRWVRGCRDEWRSLTRFLGPVAAAVLLITTIRAWTNTQFCLVLSYRGTELGVIESASVYDEAASMARDRVTNADESFTVDAVPTLTMVVRGAKTPMTATQVCDAILAKSFKAKDIMEGTGLYIDGEFMGAVADEKALEEMLESIKDGKYDKNDPNQRAEFVQEVKTETGLFPISTLREEEELLNRLQGETIGEDTYTVKAGDTFSGIAYRHDMSVEELKRLNEIKNIDSIKIGQVLVVQRPQYFLQVKVVKTVREKNVKIAYKTRTVYRDDKYTNWSNVKVKGADGKKTVTTEITELDGYEIDRVVVNEKVTQEPVTRVVEIGTKKVVTPSGSTAVQGDGVTHGKMTWPVPVCHRVYVGYSSGHRAIDISSGPIPVLGKAAVAADGGKVIEASVGWNGGYGNVVKIQHSNGLITVYAHLKSVKVAKGQQVTRGQTIGLVGNTGRSFGPHLHFEVIKNGVKVNPLNYVKP